MKNRFQTISPIDGSVYVEREIANTNDIEKALALSKSAQKDWRQTAV
ncbi:MAG: acyl-CoA reductase-like NAD-dependent aldehyde dehydrogenase, partial [Saprospiraceae bacterium]